MYNKALLVKLNKVNDEITREMKINTRTKRLKEIIGDIKIRHEILKEIQHNAIDEGADKIKIDIQYKNDQRVKISITYTGEQLKSFGSSEEIVNAILKVDESMKSNIEKKLGGKGRGLKVILCAGKIDITTIKDNKETQIKIDAANNQINQIDNGTKESFDITIVRENCPINKENGVTFELDDVDTDNIQSFEKDSLVKYIKYFTVMGKVTDNYNDKSNVKVEVKGLEKIKDEYGIECYKTTEDYEIIEMEETMEEIKKWGIDNYCSFNYIKCYNGELSSNVDLTSFITDTEYENLRNFFMEGKKCYLFRTIDSNLRNKIMINSKGVQGNFFGIYIGAEDVIINDRFTELTKKGASKSGGNLFSQYFGYIYSDKLTAAGNRNTVAGDPCYFEFKESLNENIMPIINKILSYGELKKPKKKEVVLKNVAPIEIQGLFGELKYICQDIRRIDYWTSYQGEQDARRPHDFEYENQTFSEVKTKVENDGADNNVIHISSINQLDDVVDGELYVYFLRKYANTSRRGENIFDLVKVLINNLDNDKIDILFQGIENYLKINDFRSYYDAIMLNIDSYNFSNIQRYEVIRLEIYDIDDNFPKIIRSELRSGIILDEGYKVDLNFAKAKETLLEN